MTLASRATGTLAAVALSVGALAAPAVAAKPDGAGRPEACAQQQKQLDRANDALERVNAVFARHKDKVAEAEQDVATADSASERNQARRGLDRAEEARSEAKQDKRAQQQRVAKATQRLEKCQSAPAEAPTEG